MPIVESPQGPWAKIDSFLGSTSSPALTMHRPCPICDSLSARQILRLDDFQVYTDSATVPKRLNFQYAQCTHCWALYLNPALTEFGLAVLFDEADQSYGATEGREDEQIAWLNRYSLLDSGSVVLDVGCYDAQFLARLPDDVGKVGVDIDATAIERGRARLAGQDAELICGDFETFLTDRRPGTIVMYHVLEHLMRPRQVLAKLRALAHAETRLVVEVPIVENGLSNDIVGFYSLHHMTSFSRQSLRNCLARSGWEPVEWLEQDDYNGCRVLASPTAAAASASGDPEDYDAALATLSAWNDAARSVGRRLSEIDARRCVIWGGGAHSEYLYQRTAFFQASLTREYVIVDHDLRKQGRTWRGIPILAPAELRELGDLTDVPLIVSSYQHQQAMSSEARDLGVAASNIVELYDEISVH